VTLDIGESGDSVRLSVHNHGNSIPIESQRTIFEPLARGEPDGAQGMIERGKELGFTLESSDAIGIGRDRRRQNLQRNVTL
jgi:signal transduction histidine kinase